MTFNGFISYSHAADGRLAPAVQRGLHRLAKPWHRRRALWIFRDQTGLSVTPALWTSIQTALDRSDYFVLLSSPEAAASPWVNREIEHWVATKSADHILPVVTDGEWQWDEELGDFAEDSNAVPAALRGVFTEEPLYLDLRWARDDPHLSLRHSRFRDAIAQLAAPMHGIDKDELEGEDVRQHRRAGRLRWAAVTALLFLSLAAVLTGALAVRNAAQANASAAETQRQQKLVAEQRLSAAQFAGEAQRQEGLAHDQEARAAQAGAEAERQEGLVRQQKTLVGKASAEVKVQLANADQAAKRARQQERLAKQQSALAAESARQMHRQEQRTKEQEKIAAEQTGLAAQAEAEARTQQDKAKAASAEATRQKANADQQERIAIGRRLMNNAGEVIDDDPLYALRLGIAAQRINPNAETSRGLTGMVTSTRFAGSITDVSKPAYGPNGLVAAVTGDGEVALWNTANQGIPVRLATIGGPESPFTVYLALSGDGRRLAATQNKTVSLWDLADPSHPVRTATLPADRSYSRIWFSPDGRTLVTSGGEAGSYATLWDVSDPAHPAILSSLTSPEGGSSAELLAFSGDGRTLVAYHYWVDVWDVSDLRNPVRRSGLGSGSGGVDTGTVIPVPPGGAGGSGGTGIQYESHTALALSTGTPPLLALDSTAGEIQLYDLTDPAKPVLRGVLPAPTSSSVVLDFSSDGHLLAAGYSRGTAAVWDVTKNSPSFQPTGSRTLGPQEVLRLPVGKAIDAVELSPDGKTLATADSTSTITLWSVEGFAVPRRLPETDPGGPAPGPTVDVGYGALFSPDGRTAVAEDEDELWSLQLMDLTDPAKPVKLAVIDAGLTFATARAFSPDGRTLIIDGVRGGPPGEREVQVWDLTDRSHPARMAILPSSDFRPGGVVFNPDGRTLATAGGTTVSLWDLTSRAAPVKLSTLSGVSAVRMVFSADGNTLAMVDSGRAVQLWDVTDRSKPRRLSALPRVGSPAEVTSATLLIELAFSQDGRTLAVGSGPTVSLWDVADRAKPGRIATIDLDPEATTRTMTFDKTGNVLTISGYGRWDLTGLTKLRADPAKLGCTIVGRGLNQQEWALVVPELPYRATCSAGR